ncbi:retrovirus-related pol polyprotein from transposon TNT 1-94, partial [Tanacetum coccineum]
SNGCKSACLYGKIEEEVYVCQPLGFEDLDFSDRVYNVEKALFTKVKNASTPMETHKPLLKDEDGKEVDVHMYRSMIGSLMYLTSSRPDIMKRIFKKRTKTKPIGQNRARECEEREKSKSTEVKVKKSTKVNP